MFLFKLILRNCFRHRLRTILTIVGVAVAITAFGLLRTLVALWYHGVDAASATRLITRNSISLVFSLPVSYGERIRHLPGVTGVSAGNWFGGFYKDQKHFFPNFAVEPRNFLPLYPEFVLTEAEKREFVRTRNSAMVGRKLADKYGWRVGDRVTLKGTIFPGNWEFVIAGIYRGAQKNTDESQFLFHWDYLNETLKKTVPRRAEQVGYYAVGVARPELAPQVASAVDALFRNSLAETLTETEKAFQLSFVSMTEAIMIVIKVVSYVVILIIMAVAANTMAMTARERFPEYATMKSLGFGAGWISLLIVGESLLIALAGGAAGIAVTFPAASWIETELSQYFPIFHVSTETVVLDLVAAASVGLAAAVIPAWRGASVGIADGLRRIG